jgi:hypothetical protein
MPEVPPEPPPRLSAGSFRFSYDVPPGKKIQKIPEVTPEMLEREAALKMAVDWVPLDPSAVTLAQLWRIALDLGKFDPGVRYSLDAQHAFHRRRELLSKIPRIDDLERYAQRHEMGLYLTVDVINKLMSRLIVLSNGKLDLNDVRRLTVARAAEILASQSPLEEIFSQGNVEKLRSALRKAGAVDQDSHSSEGFLRLETGLTEREYKRAMKVLKAEKAVRTKSGVGTWLVS